MRLLIAALLAALLAASALASPIDGVWAHARYLASLQTRQNVAAAPSPWGSCGDLCSVIEPLNTACGDVSFRRRRGVEECRIACAVSPTPVHANSRTGLADASHSAETVWTPRRPTRRSRDGPPPRTGARTCLTSAPSSGTRPTRTRAPRPTVTSATPPTRASRWPATPATPTRAAGCAANWT
jgi:hypothetical protein